MPTHCHRRTSRGCRCRHRSGFVPKQGCVVGARDGSGLTPATTDTCRSATHGLGTTIALARFCFPARLPFSARSKLRGRALGTYPSQLLEGPTLATAHLGGGHMQRSGRLRIAVRLAIGKSQPKFQHATVNLIKTAKQLSAQRLAIDLGHTRGLLDAAGNEIEIKRA